MAVTAGHRMAAEHRDSLDVGLDTGAAAGIRASDDEDAAFRAILD
jgi:hypothetical protein